MSADRFRAFWDIFTREKEEKVNAEKHDVVVMLDKRSKAIDVLGMPGRLISGSKEAHKGQTVFWNACVFDSSGYQIWHGDFSAQEDSKKARALADELGSVVYVTREHPFRFIDATLKLLDEAASVQQNPSVLKFSPTTRSQ